MVSLSAALLHVLALLYALALSAKTMPRLLLLQSPQ
jgi:hypothetical protein